ncbi:hypothetical protein HanPSC8_Chr05g0225131 [Helianthus annuus]|nr:hypothetical protein HanPSC8_Chr05g0225131 [Helianthus annuus]
MSCTTQVPGDIIVSARSESHSFDASRINMSHIEHYLQVVKTEVMSSSYQLIEDYDYTVHSSLVNAVTIPVAKFHFEPSPMQVDILKISFIFV